MKKIIIKLDGKFTADSIERYENEIEKQIEKHGFVVLDDSVKIYEFDDGKDSLEVKN